MQVLIVAGDNYEQLQDNLNAALEELKDKWIVDVKPFQPIDGAAAIILYADRSQKEDSKPSWRR